MRRASVYILREGSQQLRDLLGRLLEVVVEGDDDLVVGGADAREQRVVLPEVPHEVDAADGRVRRNQLLDAGPAVVRASVVHEDDLECRDEGGEDVGDPRHELFERRRAAIDGHHDGDPRA
jgi:hypothetical protein